jgi:hypothetical protein
MVVERSAGRSVMTRLQRSATGFGPLAGARVVWMCVIHAVATKTSDASADGETLSATSSSFRATNLIGMVASPATNAPDQARPNPRAAWHADC